MAGLRPVLSLVRIDDAGIRAVLNDWLGNVYVADDVAQAIVEHVYADVPRSVWPAAKATVQAQLEYLGERS